MKRPTTHDGDLVVTGNLHVVSELTVNGNLTVTGMFTDSGESSTISIEGDVTCGSLCTSGAISCGNITTTGFVIGTGNDFTLECSEIRARVVIQDDHDIQPTGIKAKLYLDTEAYWGGYAKGATKKLRRHFQPEYFTTDEDELDDAGNPAVILDVGALVDAIVASKDPFVKSTIKRAKKSKHRARPKKTAKRK